MKRNSQSIRIRGILAAALLVAPCVASAAEPRPAVPRLPENVRPLRYTAELRLDPRQPHFEGEMQIQLEFEEAIDLMWLNGTNLDVEAATLSWKEGELDAEPVPGNEDFVGIRFSEPVGPGEGTLAIRYRGSLAQEPLGLFRWQRDDHWYLFSRFEPRHARRAFPCFDEPRFSAPWTLILDVPAEMNAVTNTLGARATTRLTQAPPPAAAEAADGDEAAPAKRRLVPATTWIRYYPTPSLPSHRVALGVGPFEVTRTDPAGSEEIIVRIFVPRGRTGETAHLQEILPQILESLEADHRAPYPHGKLDLVAIPGNDNSDVVNGPGLVGFDEDLLIPEAAPRRRKVVRRATAVLTRELARQWFP